MIRPCRRGLDRFDAMSGLGGFLIGLGLPDRSGNASWIFLIAGSLIAVWSLVIVLRK